MSELVNIKFNDSFYDKVDSANWVNALSDIAKYSGLELEKELSRAKFKNPTGNLMRGHQAKHSGLKTEVINPVEYWPYVNYGTGAHVITPRNKKALYWKGAKHPVKMVHHPGIKGNHFVSEAVKRFTSSNKLQQITKKALRERRIKT